MAPALLPMATFRPISYRNDASYFTAAPLGLVLHVQQGNGSPYGYFSSLVYPDRVFSHFWVSKTGTIEQYQSTDRMSWAQGNGNATYWAVETEGYTTEPLTVPQIKGVGALVSALGVARLVQNTPGGKGLITHGAGGQDWGNHPGCPGVLRAAQRAAILGGSPARILPTYPGLNGGSPAGVQAIQRRLGGLAVDGSYGPLTRARVIAFQRTHGLAADGLVGPLTWARMWT